MEEKKVYKTQEEFFEALKKIKPCDLKDEKTSIEDAVEFCKQLMECFIAAKRWYLVPDVAKLREELKALGGCRYNEAHPKFLVEKEEDLRKFLRLANNIQFPLEAMEQVFLCDQDDFTYAFDQIAGHGEQSYAKAWLRSQETLRKEKSEE